MNKITPRTWTFIFAGIALLALVLLSISLNSLGNLTAQNVILTIPAAAIVAALVYFATHAIVGHGT